MFTGRSFLKSPRIFFPLVVCSLTLSSFVCAAEKGKKGKTETASKKAVAPVGKTAQKKETAKPALRPDKVVRHQDKGRQTKLASNSKQSEPDKQQGKKGKSVKAGKLTREQQTAEAKTKSRTPDKTARNSGNRRSRDRKQAVVRTKAVEEKNDKGRRVAAREPARDEKTDKKSDRDEKVVQSRAAALRDRELQQAVARQPERKGKFGRSAKNNETEIELVQNKPAENKAVVRQAPAATSVRVGQEPSAYSIVPDRVEVIEYDPRHAGADFISSAQRPLRTLAAQNGSFNVSSRRIEVKIDAERVFQIQDALTKKGFYAGAPTGVWDDLTYDAMKRFQISQKVDATGYPTAHSLKRLGLTSW